MIEETRSLLKRYWKWLENETELSRVDDYIEITTPYLDRHNDCIQIYCKMKDGEILLTDDGYTVNDLEFCGCMIEGFPRRQHLLTTTLNGFGIQYNEGSKALEVRTSPKDFGVFKNNLLQAILAVDDLYYLEYPSTSRPLFDVVIDWLDEIEIRYKPNVTFAGQSGLDHRFDFVIPKSNRHPERLVRTIDCPNRSTAEMAVFAWIDVKASRSPKSQAYAILNDVGSSVDQIVLDAMIHYNVYPLLWSDREQCRDTLAV